jgi:hypothetical protein
MRKIMAALLLEVAFALNAVAPVSAESATANDTARFLAGLPPAPNSPLSILTQDSLWQDHARHFNSIFARVDSNTLSRIRAFSKEHLPDKRETLLYFFSGPDFLFATSFFPTASTYVLAGLEPVGSVPQLTSLSVPAVEGSLRSLENSLGSLLSFSFFITKNMKTQLSDGPVYGTLPVLYVFLARTGKTIHDVASVGLDEKGNIQVLDEPAGAAATNQKANRSAARAIRIVFSHENGPRQTLYYFSTNLADSSVAHSGFLAFCERLGPADSFIKSASYLLHGSGFGRARVFLLNHSAMILQDDSGIPLAFFDSKNWRLQTFGRYVGPIAEFAHRGQPELAQLFYKTNAVPLDFGIGYRWRRNESNLLLAVKAAPN